MNRSYILELNDSSQLLYSCEDRMDFDPTLNILLVLQGLFNFDLQILHE